MNKDAGEAHTWISIMWHIDQGYIQLEKIYTVEPRESVKKNTRTSNQLTRPELWTLKPEFLFLTFLHNTQEDQRSQPLKSPNCTVIWLSLRTVQIKSPHSSVIKSPNCVVIWFDHRTVRWFDCPRGSQLSQEDKVVCIIYNLSSFFTSRVCPRPWKKKNWHFTHTHL